ncbi:MAG: TetR/AcrR family transcriptional regulator [bacterium]|nr:TetR/AcrR family transcriptional regulator [bacterium]
MTSYATQRFDNLPREKAARVLGAAVSEFADHGYQHANTNRIAAAAGISVGALFQYFASKDDLFRYVVGEGARAIEANVAELLAREGSVLEKVRSLLEVAVDTAVVNRESVRLYHELTSTGNRALAHELAMQLEGYTAAGYRELMEQGQESGEVRADVPAAVLALCLDNLLVGLQLSFAADYYEDRLQLYAPGVEREALVEQTLRFVESAIGAAR